MSKRLMFLRGISLHKRRAIDGDELVPAAQVESLLHVGHLIEEPPAPAHQGEELGGVVWSGPHVEERGGRILSW